MKKIFYKGLFIAMLATTFTASAVDLRFPSIPKTIINTPAISINVREADSETLNEILQGKLPNTSLEISKDELLPLNLFLKGDFIELANSESHNLCIRANQDLFFRNVDGAFLFSSDNRNWKPLLECITGSLTIALGLDHLDEPMVTLGAEILERN